MYQYLLGNKSILPMYDLIGILGYFVIIYFYFFKTSFKEQLNKENENQLHLKEIILLFLTHVISFTFSGEFFGSFIGKRTDFFGYVLITTFFIYIVSFLLKIDILKQIDELAPIFVFNAALLKIACFCAGCCNGIQWKYGLFNYATNLHEFPIQLIEGLFYILLFVFIEKTKKRYLKGYLFTIFLISYSSFRFIIQFFRTDEKIFSLYHSISIYALLLGLAILFLLKLYHSKKVTAK